MELCAYCEALAFEPVPVAEEHGASGPGRIIYAHPEHAHLVQPDPRPIALLERIRARRGQS